MILLASRPKPPKHILPREVWRRGDITSIFTCLRVQSAQLLYNEKKVYLCFWRPSDVWDYRYNFAVQAVQELLQLTLLTCHLDIESVDSVFHFPTSFSRQILLLAQRVVRSRHIIQSTKPWVTRYVFRGSKVFRRILLRERRCREIGIRQFGFWTRAWIDYRSRKSGRQVKRRTKTQTRQ